MHKEAGPSCPSGSRRRRRRRRNTETNILSHVGRKAQWTQTLCNKRHGIRYGFIFLLHLNMISHILCVFINSLVLINRAVFTAPPPHGVHMTPCCVHGQVQSGSGLRQRLHLTQLTFPRLTAPCCTATCRPAAELQERHSFTVVERHPVAKGRHYTAYNKDTFFSMGAQK